MAVYIEAAKTYRARAHAALRAGDLATFHGMLTCARISLSYAK